MQIDLVIGTDVEAHHDRVSRLIEHHKGKHRLPWRNLAYIDSIRDEHAKRRPSTSFRQYSRVLHTRQALTMPTVYAVTARDAVQSTMEFCGHD